ncbi:MAG TPA: bifunctional DNA-formamidopyrimidine glycosylase/DNA-(apurinic or apyrimidinic site) lyase [Thermodesulfobacteriota bacterium]|nr:bifunctional DNA-formamidopyrimidine glycosylase/DNA-(apurinic or apyrimidinic site) lyase [Thermodesulfobacteriota bacterium]
MPELPEVETIVRGLRERVRDLEFSSVDVRLPKCVRGSRKSFAVSLCGKRVVEVDRRGKNIVFRLSCGNSLIIHLGMSGRLRVVESDAPLEKHTHVVFEFRDRSDHLRFVDPRQFGRVSWDDGGRASPLARLGPEPLTISAEEFAARAAGRRREIKPLLLDQQFLAGVGNIYADESLHRAGIHPRSRSHRLSGSAAFRLHGAIREVLEEAIRARGTSVRSYVDAAGSAGAFQKLLRVYGREGEPCTRCGTPIRRERIGGRSTFFCPRCQRRKNVA